jgi:transposase
VQYGPTIGAIAVYLVQLQLLPLARACEVMEDLLAVSISEGTLSDLIGRCANNLTVVEQQIKEALIQSEVIQQDETGLYVQHQRQWMHVTCTPTLMHYGVHASRGREALEAIGILPRFADTSVHDGWRSYFLYDCRHALCLVHLVRELIFLAEEQQQKWAGELKALLLDMKTATEDAYVRGMERRHPSEIADGEAQFLDLLAQGEVLNPVAHAPPGTRGQSKQSPAPNLLDRLLRDQEAVLRFLQDLTVPFDKNFAERDIWMVKVQQKVSGCFRALSGAQAFCRIRGYLSTMRKQGLPLLSAMQTTLLGHPILPSFQRT